MEVLVHRHGVTEGHFRLGVFSCRAQNISLVSGGHNGCAADQVSAPAGALGTLLVRMIRDSRVSPAVWPYGGRVLHVGSFKYVQYVQHGAAVRVKYCALFLASLLDSTGQGFVNPLCQHGRH
jgi:hypothetical protein